ncbi:MAG: hypothetical protein B6U97_02615 [Candidatus Altiarchaeales archaeon ex4484_96]|nr:MAG: hypothetical protein B6U97_02615 [Candidatus Altiarchaeales archaeon ex4484_96]
MGEEQVEKHYPVLKEMVEKANQYNIKLTLMFSAQWADIISEDPKMMSEIKQWQSQGHEISSYHHSINHKGS